MTMILASLGPVPHRQICSALSQHGQSLQFGLREFGDEDSGFGKEFDAFRLAVRGFVVDTSDS